MSLRNCYTTMKQIAHYVILLLYTHTKYCQGPMSRPKKPAEEKLYPVAVYVTKDLKERLEASAKHDKRSISGTLNFMVEHCLSCHIYTQGHVPADQIHLLRGQRKKS